MVFTMDTDAGSGSRTYKDRGPFMNNEKHLQYPSTSKRNFEASQENDVQEDIVRSVGMSANIASTVKTEVKHLIRVNTFDDTYMSSDSDTEHKKSQTPQNSPMSSRNCRTEVNQANGLDLTFSYILPPADICKVFAIVLSKWDDIMGPQSIHVWLPEKSGSNEQKAFANDSTQEDIQMRRAVKYVTCHTVNYMGLGRGDNPQTSVFVVPDLELVAQSLVFHWKERRLLVPYSLAVVVNYSHYSAFLHLRQLLHNWLHLTAQRIQSYLKVMPYGATFATNTKLNDWMLELCYMLVSLNVCGVSVLPSELKSDILFSPLLERGLTSHLQTFGCSVIMSTSVQEINQFISFFAMFLDVNEKACSRYVVPNMKYSFHIGLFLQGLLMDEFGCRELSSADLTANPYPVTAIDLTLGSQLAAIKQTSLKTFCPGRLIKQQVFSDEEFASDHRSILHPVNESSYMVRDFLKGLKCLSVDQWSSFTKLFIQKINAYASCLLSQIQLTKESQENVQPQQLLMQNLKLDAGDFLIVLAAAEKLKPGIYAYVLRP